MSDQNDVLIVETPLENQQAFFNEDGNSEDDDLCKVMMV